MASCGGPWASLSLFASSSSSSSSSNNIPFRPAMKPASPFSRPTTPHLSLSLCHRQSSPIAAAPTVLSSSSSSSSHLRPCNRGYGTLNSKNSKPLGTKHLCRAARRVVTEEEVHDGEEDDEDEEVDEDGDYDDDEVVLEDAEEEEKDDEVEDGEEKYRFPDPIPEFAKSETEKFKSYMLQKLSKKKEIFKDSVEEVVDICTEIFSEFLHTEYGGPGTLLINPFADMNDEINELGLPGGPRAARSAVVWAQKHVDKDWEEWTGR